MAPSDVPQDAPGYELLHELGSGTRTHAHAARNPEGRLCVLRVLRPEVSPQQMQTAFAAGASSLLDVEPPTLDRSRLGHHFEAPLLTADPLSLRPLGAIPLPAALELATRVAERLARKPGRVHGNLCERHILLDQEGEVALIDPDPMHPGWVGTRAPEQAEHPPTPASDVYALGCLLFSWLSGETVPSSALDEAVRTERVQNIQRYGLPLELQLLMRKMLRADPEQRLADPDAVADALRLVSVAEAPGALRRWLHETAWQRSAFWIRLLAHHETLDDAPVDESAATHLDAIEEVAFLASAADTGIDTLVDMEPDPLVLQAHDGQATAGAAAAWTSRPPSTQTAVGPPPHFAADLENELVDPTPELPVRAISADLEVPADARVTAELSGVAPRLPSDALMLDGPPSSAPAPSLPANPVDPAPPGPPAEELPSDPFFLGEEGPPPQAPDPLPERASPLDATPEFPLAPSPVPGDGGAAPFSFEAPPLKIDGFERQAHIPTQVVRKRLPIQKEAVARIEPPESQRLIEPDPDDDASTPLLVVPVPETDLESKPEVRLNPWWFVAAAGLAAAALLAWSWL